MRDENQAIKDRLAQIERESLAFEVEQVRVQEERRVKRRSMTLEEWARYQAGVVEKVDGPSSWRPHPSGPSYWEAKGDPYRAAEANQYLSLKGRERLMNSWRRKLPGRSRVEVEAYVKNRLFPKSRGK